MIRKISTKHDYEYLYEGIYDVVDVYYGPGRDGPKVYRFQLRRAVS